MVQKNRSHIAAFDSLMDSRGGGSTKKSRRAQKEEDSSAEDDGPAQHGSEEEDDEEDKRGDADAKTKGRSRRELPARAVSILKEWLLSEEHFTHPYPTTQDQQRLMQMTGIGKKQLKNWFTNARRRIWKPLIKKQLEEAKNAAAYGMSPAEAERAAAVAHAAHAAGIGRGAYESLFPGGLPPGGPSSAAAGNSGVGGPYPPTGPPPPSAMAHHPHGGPPPHRHSEYHGGGGGGFHRGEPQGYFQSLLNANQALGGHPGGQGPHYGDAGGYGDGGGPGGSMTSPPLTGSSMHRVPSLGFSGGMPRAPSVGRFTDNMKKTDSMTFLEVFLQDAANGGLASSNTLSQSFQNEGSQMALARAQSVSSLGMPRTLSGNLPGMCLDGDEDQPHSLGGVDGGGRVPTDAASLSEALPPAASLLELRSGSSGSLSSLVGHKRSINQLSDAAASPEYYRQHPAPPRDSNCAPAPPPHQQHYLATHQYHYSRGPDDAYLYASKGQPQSAPPPPPPFPADMKHASSRELIRRVSSHELVNQGKAKSPGEEVMSTAVRVPRSAKCAFCQEGDVDTQLQPCGHLFHGRCLKPWLQASDGPPRCLQCQTPISSCVLAIPVDSMEGGLPSATSASPPPPDAGPNAWRSDPTADPDSPSFGGTKGNDIAQDAPTIDGDDVPPPTGDPVAAVRATVATVPEPSPEPAPEPADPEPA